MTQAAICLTRPGSDVSTVSTVFGVGKPALVAPVSTIVLFGLKAAD